MKKLLLLLFLVLATIACASELAAPTKTPWPTRLVTPRATPTPRKTRWGIPQMDFLAQNPCSAPCFFDITPDITTEEETIAIIEDYPSIFKGCKITDRTEEGQGKGLVCVGVTIYFSEGYVNSIHYFVDPPISLSQFINIYGSPDKVWLMETSFPEYELVIAPTLFFHSIQTEIYLPEYEGDQYEITPDILIDGVIHDSVSEYETWRHFYKLLIPWDGYGVYDYTKRDKLE